MGLNFDSVFTHRVSVTRFHWSPRAVFGFSVEAAERSTGDRSTTVFDADDGGSARAAYRTAKLATLGLEVNPIRWT